MTNINIPAKILMEAINSLPKENKFDTPEWRYIFPKSGSISILDAMDSKKAPVKSDIVELIFRFNIRSREWSLTNILLKN